MINREIPFRPKLEGDFRLRFFYKASAITDNVTSTDIEDIAHKEIFWATHECNVNITQRKKYRAVWYLLRDLIRASWKACYHDGTLYMKMPSITDFSVHSGSVLESKSLIRKWMSESRNERLSTFTDFVKRMEKKNSNGHDVSELIADGEELETRLERLRMGQIGINEAVSPYLQLVEENSRDSFTGLKLSEIWHYFRLTWSTPSETTPGRTMQYLVRDAAHPMHAVMGIASLENCAVQITDRDEFIGWNKHAFIKKIRSLPNEKAIQEFHNLLRYIEDGISGIDYSEICNKAEIENPTNDVIKRLQNNATNAEQKRQDALRTTTKDGLDSENKSELGSISRETEEALYQRKRSEQLARLLIAKKKILDLISTFDALNDNNILESFCESEDGSSAIRNALVAQKTKHIGSSLLELNVCGAIPPYNELLGGKLVALLALSPQVIHDYKKKYKDKASEIASRLKGEDVCRPADLVYIGTTSLYSVGSSQYNRLKIPQKIFGASFDVVWKKIGTTVGFGTLHISKATTRSLTEATSNGFTRINHVFGEGASPKMRLLTMAIRELLESSNDDSKDFSKHAMSRIVYGACLAENTSEYLLGKSKEPMYYTDINNYQDGTRKIIEYWQNRWLTSRLKYEPIYERIRNFNKKNFMVGCQINEGEKWEFQELGDEHMPKVNDKKSGLQFIRDFYRGSSAYADHIPSDLLSHIHLITKLDGAIIDEVKNGKDVVLTGNPGDGKTHIIRMLKPELEKLGGSVEIVLDASALSNKEIYENWVKSRNEKRPYIIAINAAILYSVHNEYRSFEPIDKAYRMITQSTIFHDEQLSFNDIAVFDLSKREVLTLEMLSKTIAKLTNNEHYTECVNCKMHDECAVTHNRKLLKNQLFQSRLSNILDRVVLRGYHATLRELQGLVSYLIFGNQSCVQLSKTAGNDDSDITQLIYSGKGLLFDYIRHNIDPANISHPVWDEILITNKLETSSWTDGYHAPVEAIAPDNEKRFYMRKRQFYFFNEHGEELLGILDDDVSRYQKFILLDDKKMIKELIRKINAFFGENTPSNSELIIWSGHRFDNEPRKVLVSSVRHKVNGFSIGRPKLQPDMCIGIDMVANYVRLEKKESPNIFLKINFDMYKLLTEAERGVPVLFLESDIVKKVWRFVEQLHSTHDIDDDTIDIKILDVQNKRRIDVSIDKEDGKYLSVNSYKAKES